MKIRHNLSGTIGEVISQNSKTIIFKVIVSGLPTLKVGDKQKTGVAAIGKLWTIIED